LRCGAGVVADEPSVNAAGPEGDPRDRGQGAQPPRNSFDCQLLQSLRAKLDQVSRIGPPVSLDHAWSNACIRQCAERRGKNILAAGRGNQEIGVVDAVGARCPCRKPYKVAEWGRIG